MARSHGERIDDKIKPMPYSLKSFLKETVTDDDRYGAFLESPVMALVRAGVPVDPQSFRDEDVDRLVSVITRIYEYVKEKKVPGEARFSDIFGASPGCSITDPREYQICDNKTDWNKQDSHCKQRSDSGNTPSFKFDANRPPWEMRENILQAPLMNPRELDEILSRVETSIR